MIILGLSGFVTGHDASAAIVKDGKVIAAVDEERFNRIKHSTGIPLNAIKYCLYKCGVDFHDLDYIGFNYEPDIFLRHRYRRMLNQYDAIPEIINERKQQAETINQVENELKQAFKWSPHTKFEFISHHLAHAVSAFYTSPFESSAILIVDGSGDNETASLFQADSGGVKRIHNFLINPESIGVLYSAFTHLAGFHAVSGPGKLMGLAGFGRIIPNYLDGIVKFTDDATSPIHMDMSFTGCHLKEGWFSRDGWRRFGPRRDSGQEEFSQYYIDMAATVQDMTEKCLLSLARASASLLPEMDSLCLAGGVALNISANRKIAQSGLFQHYYFTPAASDSGTSLGCAVYLFNRYRKNDSFIHYSPRNNPASNSENFSVYLGPHIEDDFDIREALDRYPNKIIWEKFGDEVIEEAARSLAEGQIIGWAQGQMEWGPRALGNRSILANPLIPDMKARLDQYVKKREPFRPYAASVLAEEAANWFTLPLNRFMLLEANVRDEVKKRIPCLVHVDGTCRPQLVFRNDNELYFLLLTHFYNLTGCPMLLNTSFNMHGEPIVNTPDEVINDLLNSGLDAVYMGKYKVRRIS